MSRRILIGVAMIALGLGLLLPDPRRAAAASPAFSLPQHYYLSLGDSLAFGYQQFKVDAQLPNVHPATFNTGYTDDFAAMLAVVRPDVQTENYACPGEITSEFLSSPGCPSYPFPIHASYSGSQLDAAVAFLKAHPGQVNPITVSMGSNDVERVVQACGGFTPAGISCAVPKLPGVVSQAGVNLARIFATLRQAAPNAEIIAVQPYNPVAVNPDLAATSNLVIQALDKAIAQGGAPAGVILADAFTPFDLAPNQPATLCRLTLMCTASPGIHASDGGYAVIAQQIWNVSGYNKLASLFVVGFDSSQPGQGKVYFGTGPGCAGLVQVGTMDIHPGTTTHAVVVTGNDLPGTIGNIGLPPGGTYWYETVTATSAGEQIDNSGGACYSVTVPTG